MKNYFYILNIIMAVLLVFTGCEKEVTTQDPSVLTYYVTFDLEGEDLMTLPKGTDFVEPGYTALEGTNDVTSKVTVKGSVDESEVGLYTITYSAINKDGYSSSAQRTVIIYDPDAPETDLSGIYTSNILRNDLLGDPISRGPFSITITKMAPGFFYVSDFLGGWYQYGAGYGASYAMTGYIQLNSDNTLSYISSFIKGWDDSLDDFYSGEYDPGTKTLIWSAFYSGRFEFNVTAVFASE